MAATDESARFRIDVEDAVGIWDRACGPASAQFDLVPGQAIERYDATHQQPLQRIPLPDWTAFENGHIDWDHRDFARLLGLDDVPEGVALILVTDEGLRDKCAFRFPRSELASFTRWYEANYGMDFFQSADYLIFDENLEHIRILHHEGVVFRK